ncbi:unnamed protein product [Haemonchus placei]|uniref:Alpha/beta hydrolase n=1 Tax=Haemonchus placei TaxID=6290 RepID=A0A0N4WE48_HAEPC|nr:unnamed protein product [Haemonchus placei]
MSRWSNYSDTKFFYSYLSSISKCQIEVHPNVLHADQQDLRLQPEIQHLFQMLHRGL